MTENTSLAAALRAVAEFADQRGTGTQRAVVRDWCTAHAADLERQQVLDEGIGRKLYTAVVTHPTAADHREMGALARHLVHQADGAAVPAPDDGGEQ